MISTHASSIIQEVFRDESELPSQVLWEDMDYVEGWVGQEWVEESRRRHKERIWGNYEKRLERLRNGER